MAQRTNSFLRWILAIMAVVATGWVAYEEFYQEKIVSPLSTYEEAGRAMRDGQFSRALNLYETVLLEKPDLTPAVAGKALALTQMGMNPEALAIFNQLLLAEPRSAGTHANRGVVLERMGRIEDALTAYEAALSLDPTLAGRPNALLAQEAHNKVVTIDQRARRLRAVLRQ